MEPLSLVIPAFNEAETIASVIHEIPAAHRLDFIISPRHLVAVRTVGEHWPG